MASPRVPQAKVKAVANAFIGMSTDPVGKQVLAAAVVAAESKNLLSFVAATDGDYAAYHDFYRRAPASLQ